MKTYVIHVTKVVTDEPNEIDSVYVNDIAGSTLKSVTQSLQTYDTYTTVNKTEIV